MTTQDKNKSQQCLNKQNEQIADFSLQTKNQEFNINYIDTKLQQLVNSFNKSIYLQICNSYVITEINEFLDMKSQLNLSSCNKTLFNRLLITKNKRIDYKLLPILKRSYRLNHLLDLSLFDINYILYKIQNNISFFVIDIVCVTKIDISKDVLLMLVNNSRIKSIHLNIQQYVLIQSNLLNNLCNISVYGHWQTSNNDLKQLINIKYRLNLSYCKLITDEGFQYLSNMIYDLNLSYCNITDQGLKYLINMKHKLDLSGCKYISDDGLKYLQNITDNLNLSNCDNITNNGLKYLTNITHNLNLSNCSLISDEGLVFLTNIKHNLNISYCFNITDKGLQLLNNLTSNLNIYGCNITDDGIVYLSNIIDGLKIGSNNITNNTLIILKKGKLQKKLYLKNCPNITNDGLLYLSDIQEIVIENCKQISQEGLSNIKCV